MGRPPRFCFYFRDSASCFPVASSVICSQRRTNAYSDQQMTVRYRPPFQNGAGPANAVTATEVEKLIKVAKDNQYGHADVALILIAFRSASLNLRRPKNSKPLAHPLRGDEIRALRKLRRNFQTSDLTAWKTDHSP
jgi:hypothetical protein